LSGAI
ncbi:hypothetical protein AB1N83_011217, partial [Pleurotus pulmonarius]